MTEFPFKNLAGAKEEFGKLQAELTALRESSAQTTEQIESLQTEKEELTAQVTNFKTALEAANVQLAEKDSVIAAKDAEINELTSGVEVLKVANADLEKTQKSVKAQARELVAASAGTPAAVDHSEMELTEPQLVKAMAKEQDPKKLGALYEKYNKQVRGKGK